MKKKKKKKNALSTTLLNIIAITIVTVIGRALLAKLRPNDVTNPLAHITSPLRGAVIEPHAVTDDVPQLAPNLRRHAPGHGNRRHSARLRAANYPSFGETLAVLMACFSQSPALAAGLIRTLCRSGGNTQRAIACRRTAQERDIRGQWKFN